MAPKSSKQKITYGGPFAEEIEAIDEESLKETPDYDALIKDWSEISEGAIRSIVEKKNPTPVKDGVFVRNVRDVEEEPIPTTVHLLSGESIPVEKYDEYVKSINETEEQAAQRDSAQKEEASSRNAQALINEKPKETDDFGL